jgi:O-antigen/teichoic acid export membrane protein
MKGSSNDAEPNDRFHEHTDRLNDVVSNALRGLFGRDSLYMILWCVQLVAAAFVTPIMTRVLDAPNFGKVAAANAVMQILFVLAGLGLYQAIQRQFAADCGARDAAKLVSLSILGSVVLTASADLTGPLWAHQVGFASYTGLVRMAVLWAGLSAVTNSALALLRSQDRLLAFSTVSLLQSVVAEVTSLLFVAFLEATATMFILGQVMVQGVAAIVALIITRPRMLRREDSAVVKRALAFGLPLIPAALSTFVLNSSDRLIVQSQLGSGEVGRYQVAYNVGALPMLLLGVLNSSWMPRIFSFKVVDERAAVISASRDLLYKLLMPVLIGLAVGAPLILHIWAPSAYQPDSLLMVTSLVLVTAVPYTAALSSTRSLLAEGRTVFIAAAQATAAGVNVLLNFMLIPHFHLEGSAAATFLAFALLHVLLWARARTLSRVEPPTYRLRLALLATVGLSVGVATVSADDFMIYRLVVVVLSAAWFGFVFITTTGIVARAHNLGPHTLNYISGRRRS